MQLADIGRRIPLLSQLDEGRFAPRPPLQPQISRFGILMAAREESQETPLPPAAMWHQASRLAQAR